MKTIALLNLKSGCGATTVAANLADILSISHKTWLWQTDEMDQLSLHYGQSIDLSVEWKAELDSSCFNNKLDSIYSSDLPFTFFSNPHNSGFSLVHIDDCHCLSKLSRTLKQFDEQGTPSYSVVHIPHEFHRFVDLSELFDLVIVVGAADAQTYQRLNMLNGSLNNSYFDNDNVKLLINRYSPELSIENDLYTIISDEFTDRILPDPIFNSPEFLEAAANMVTLKSYANKSFAHKNIENLAQWCGTWLEADTDSE
ncbi:ParA family protein [Vibrio sp. RC27]